MNNVKDNVLPKWLQLGDGIATVALSRPSQANGIQVDKLTLREPTVREMRAATLQGGINEEEQEMVLFCSLASIGRADLEGLLMRDYRRLQTAYFRLGADDGV
ncbi:phage tail assembly protein [Pseudomonas azerbaijanorientalis]|uniref:phage tail assembly protein n=1 Tax=Pseudomonas azerbaijanorientalis TaxID=2842350 RepID=UPI001C3D46CA|nr:phage tail assembly protein [Pseudomonas azerbaijanorientalis]QXH63822.1 phage tail assembly protein [Pseudomonas azerbaijanorientalis]